MKINHDAPAIAENLRTQSRAWLIAGACLSVLGACAPFSSSENESYRDINAAIGATTRFDAERFAGDWFVVASFDPVPKGAVTFAYNPEPQTLVLSSEIIPDRIGTYEIASAGVLKNNGNPARSLIVMWVDEGFRTAALGTALGDFGVILNRQEEAPADRLQASRDVLDFYGWDISKLKETKP